MKQSFGRQEKLKSSILISKMFKEGRSMNKFPIRLVFLPLEKDKHEVHKAAVSVPKRSFKRAVDRTHLKRLMREAYRKNKYLVTTNGPCFAFLFIYVGKQKEDYHKIFEATEELLRRFAQSEMGK